MWNLSLRELVLIAFALGLAIGAGGMWQVQDWRADSAQLSEVKHAQKATNTEQTRRSDIADDYQKRRTQLDSREREFQAAIDAWALLRIDSAAACVLDDAGLQIWNAANAGSDGSSAAPVVRYDSTESELGRITEPAAQPRSDSQPVPPNLRPAQRAD